MPDILMRYSNTLSSFSKPVFFLLLPVLFWCTGFSQLTYVRSLTVNDGLPQGQVRGVVQDKQGFIWIASEGLSRYDGRSFLNFTHVFGDSTTIADNYIRSLQIDTANNLWIVYVSNQVDVMNATTGKVKHLSTWPAFSWLKPPGNGHITIRWVGNRLFALNGSSLAAFDGQTGIRQAIPLPAGERIAALGNDEANNPLLATDKRLYSISGNRLQALAALPPPPPDVWKYWQKVPPGGMTIIGNILSCGKGNLAIAVYGGIHIYNRQAATSHFYADRYPNAQLYYLLKGKDGAVYYLTGEGVRRLTKDEPPQLVMPLDMENLGANLEWNDQAGTIWVSWGVQGLRLFDVQPVNFRSVPVHKSFAADVLDPWLHQQAALFDFHSYGLRSAKDTWGNNWLLNCSYHFGLLAKTRNLTGSNDLYRFSGNQLVKVFAAPAGTFNAFAIDGRNQCWLLLYDTTAHKTYIAKANLQQHTTVRFATLPGPSVENPYLTPIGNQLAALNDYELRLYDTATAACEVYPLSRLRTGGRLLMAVPDRQQRNILWIATKGGGIIKLNIANGTTQHYTEAEGLPNNVVYYIAPDKKGFFWCSSNKGLFRFSPADGSVVSFTVKDGLQGNEFNRYHFLEMPDGHFWFGGTEGHTVFHPDSVFLDSYQPPVVLTGLRINDVPLQKLSPHWKDTMPSNLASITLPYYQNQLSFSFAGLQYNAPEKLQYRYRLTGINNDWVYAGYDAHANYAAIPPGHYVLQINASNTAGQWSQHVKTLEITITPPWWRTGWMYTIYAAVLITAGWLYFRSRLRRLQLRQQVVLKQREAEQAQALEETKSRFFANITHELRTPLTLILSPVQQQLQEGAATYSPRLLKGVYHNSQMLLRLINQLLDMSKLEAGNLPLNLHRGHVAAFIESLLPPFQQQAAARSIRFLFSVNEEREAEKEHLFDSDKLEKVLHNLLSNAFKFTPEGGQISCRLSVSQLSAEHGVTIHSPRLQPGETGGAIFQIQVSDTGIGIPPEHLPHIFDRFYQVNTSTTRRYEGTGIGLSLVKEFTDLMGGTIQVESTPGSGSVFTLTLPMTIAVGSEMPVAPPHPEIVETIAAIANIPQEQKEEKPLVLVVDDNEQLRHFIKEALQLHYRVLTAVNGEAALQLAATELPELIISDVMMPVMDGYVFCQKVKENPLTSHTGFILLTAKTADESRVSGLRLGADHYLNKPFMVEELLLVTGNLLRRQQQLRAFYHKQLQQPAKKLPPVQEVEDAFLRSVYSIIESNLDSDKLNVDFLAGEMAVSRRTLNRKLAAIADTSATEVIRNYRLKKAAEMLRKGEPVSSAAYATGFSTPSYFSQCFRETYGVSPGQWVENGEVADH